MDKRKIDRLLSELIFICVSIKLESRKAHFYLHEGVLIRLGLIRRSFELFFEAFGTIANNDYECETLNVALNSIYLHLRGVLDNFAWIIYYELQLTNLKQRDIDLLGNKFLNSLECDLNLKKDLEVRKNWLIDLKNKRDPVVHRLPLYIPAKFITSKEDLSNAMELKCRAKEKKIHNDESFIIDEFAAMEIGDFKPIILNLNVEDSSCKFYEILSEIENDIKNFVEICGNISKYLNKTTFE